MGQEAGQMERLSGAEVKLSKKISCVLRHKPELAGLTMDKHGWVSVSDLIKALPTDIETLEKIVALNDKKRFIFSEDKSRIRACQGHTIEVDVELKEAVPPKYLYHGTLMKNRERIEKEGLHPMKRLYVHLSADVNTAWSVAKRRKSADGYVIYRIDTEAMIRSHCKFWQAENGVWLTNSVASKYLDEYETLGK